MKTDMDKTMVKRFHPARLLEHQVNAIAFFMLVLTGLSQRFYETDWAGWVIVTLGGIDNVRLVHRFTGIAFASLLILHVLVGCYGMFFKRWSPSMVINRRPMPSVFRIGGASATAISSSKIAFSTSPTPRPPHWRGQSIPR